MSFAVVICPDDRTNKEPLHRLPKEKQGGRAIIVEIMSGLLADPEETIWYLNEIGLPLKIAGFTHDLCGMAAAMGLKTPKAIMAAAMCNVEKFRQMGCEVAYAHLGRSRHWSPHSSNEYRTNQLVKWTLATAKRICAEGLFHRGDHDFHTIEVGQVFREAAVDRQVFRLTGPLVNEQHLEALSEIIGHMGRLPGIHFHSDVLLNVRERFREHAQRQSLYDLSEVEA